MKNEAITVIKRDGSSVPLDINKIHRVLTWAVQDLEDVSVSDIEMNAGLHFHEGISTTDIHNSLVKSASDLISKENPDYQYVAARLLLYKLRKDVWGESEPPRLLEHIKRCVELGVYDGEILEKYTESEIHKIGKIIDHSRDSKFTYAGLAQFVDKYAVQNRKTNQVYETPQFAYLVMAMTVLSNYPKSQRISLIKRTYNAFSLFKINLPTPIMRNVRTGRKFFSSCTLIEVDDTLDSIFASAHAIGRYTASNSGIGLNTMAIRAIDSPIRDGEEIHAGLLPFYKVFESSTKSCTQTGSRRGAITVNQAWWHPEIETVMVLKNNAGTDETRVRKMDYCIAFDRTFLERLQRKEEVSLFSSSDVPGLKQAFGTPEFKELYLKYEQDPNIPRKTVPAEKIAEIFLRERMETNRIYCLFIDNTNNQGSFKDTVQMTNLCCLSGDNKIEVTIDGLPCTVSLEELVELFNTTERKITVLSKNLENGSIEYKKLLAAIMTKTVDELFVVTDTDSSKKVICTGDHEFYTKNRGYVRADELKEDDILDCV